MTFFIYLKRYIRKIKKLVVVTNTYRLKSFNKWLNEDFAQVGAPPDGNMLGMGPVIAPNSGTEGSGDAWPSIGAPYSLVPLGKTTRRRKKRKNRKKSELAKNK